MTESKHKKRTFKQEDKSRFIELLKNGDIVPSKFAEEALCLEIQKQLNLKIAPNAKSVKRVCTDIGVDLPMPEPSAKRSGGYETGRRIAEQAARALKLLQEDYEKEMRNLGKAEKDIVEIKDSMGVLEDTIGAMYDRLGVVERKLASLEKNPELDLGAQDPHPWGGSA
jgi:hypothetical protein